MADNYKNYKDIEFVTSWMDRIHTADEVFKKWQGQFKCKTLDKYYEGRQWPGGTDGYTINMIYSTWKTKKPSLLFKEPRVQFTPNPGKSDWDYETASHKAKLATDLVNTLIGDCRMGFAENCSMALLDTGSYFGMLEIGYSADWIMNPNAGLPEVSSDYDDSVTPDKVKVKEPDQIPDTEWIYVKRIMPERVRVGGNFHWQLEKNSWVGYYEYVRPIDIKEDLKDEVSTYDTSKVMDEIGESQDSIINRGAKSHHVVWKIWDMRAKKFFMLDESAQKIIRKPEDFKRLPLKLLSFDPRRKGCYPIPLFYNWLTMQDDLNESMEQLRAHRRRSKRLFQAPEGLLEPEEIDKFKSLPDGTLIITKMANGKIDMVPNSSVDQTVVGSVQIAKDNFNNVSGVSSDVRGESDRITATQASISAKAGSVREFSEREIVASWLGAVCLEVLELAIEKMALPIWIKLMQDSQNALEDVKIIQSTYELITTDELGGYVYSSHISMDSMSPITNDEEKTKFLEFLAVLQQYPIISLNPTIIAELAKKLGYNNEAVIQALQQQALQQQMANNAAMAQNIQGVMGNAGGQEPNTAQKTVEQMQPPSQGQIENQLANQGVPIQ